MIVIQNTTVKNIPILNVVDENFIHTALPTLIYFHGFTSSKEQDLPQAYILAEKGYRVILPDSIYHGDRTTNKDSKQIQFEFWNIVMKNLEDLNNLYIWLNENQLILDGRIGVAGTSMGGITVSAALTQFDWIKAAGLMMGSAKISEMAAYLIKGIRDQGIELPMSQNEIDHQLKNLEAIDLSKQLQKLNNRPLFIWHGESDLVVPFQHSASFVEMLNSLPYPKDKFQFIKEPNRDHKVSREAKYALRDWLIQHL